MNPIAGTHHNMPFGPQGMDPMMMILMFMMLSPGGFGGDPMMMILLLMMFAR